MAASSSGTWPRERPRAYSASVVSGVSNATRAVKDARGEESLTKRTVRFQCGLFREEETFIGEDVKILCKETLLEYVCDLLTIRFPEHPYGDLSSKVILLQHNAGDGLSPLSDMDEIPDGCLLEIVLKDSAKQEADTNICPHLLQVQSYKGPTFCDHCGRIMIGIAKQGLKCEGCGLNFHKRCAVNIPNNCSRLQTSTSEFSASSSKKASKELWSGRPLWIDRALQERPELPHTFAIKTYTSLTACHHCKRLMRGLFRQGVQCKDCKINCHKRCSKLIGRNCLGEMFLNYRADAPGTATLPRPIGPAIIQNPDALAEEPEKEEVPELSVSAVSSEGSVSSATSQDNTQRPSTASPADAARTPQTSNGGVMPVVMEEKDPTPVPQELPSDAGDSRGEEAALDDSSSYIPLQRVVVTMQYSKQNNAMVLMEGWMVHYTNRNPVRKKYYWKLDTKCLTMYTNNTTMHVHQEIQLSDMLAVDPPADVSSSSLFLLSPPHVFEIVTAESTFFCGIDLNDVTVKDVQVIAAGTIVDHNEPNILRGYERMSPGELESIGIGSDIGINWGEALHSALMPMTPAMSLSSLSDVGYPMGGYQQSFRGSTQYSFRSSTRHGSKRGSLRGSIHRNQGKGSLYNPTRVTGGSIYNPKGSFYGQQRTPQTSFYGQARTPGSSVYGGGRYKGSFRGSFRVPKGNEHPPGLEKPPGLAHAGELKPVVETNMDIGLFYQIYPSEVLGSGQFGTVYGGVHRNTNHPVAVKVIDKLRFPNKHENALKHEVAILQHLNHPGIVTLEQMFETPEKIYVVMEKMHGDMLELILSSPDSKLTERLTKFFVYQILTALRYLHSKDVVHCDLKPENVLLASGSPFPQTKLCDFGFARIIGENHFRKSIVGTPAYLAPEVLRNQGYNRSLDLWSVGVIIYVSLSGTFPFNEDEEIADQIHNAAFMFPPDPWETITRDAIDLINKLLQVEKRKRYQVSKALNHPWLQDRQTYEDLRDLEKRAKTRYLTHEGQDTYWQSTGADKGSSSSSTSAIATHSTSAMSPVQGKAMNGTAPAVEQQPVGHRKSALDKTDAEVAKTEKRATTIGYKVSTV